MELPFDKIVVDEGGQTRAMKVAEFMALTLPVRIRLVMTGSLKFYAGDQPVAQGEALNALQKKNVK